MLDQESDEPFVRSKRRAMNTDRNLIGVVAVLIAKIEVARLSEIDLVGRQRELASDHAPNLHIDFRSVKRGFVRHFDVIDAGIF